MENDQRSDGCEGLVPDKRNPWMKWYPSDWRADTALRMCSLGARGLWIEMLGMMHEAEIYGHLYVAGKPPTDAQLATLVGALPKDVARFIGELGDAGVFSRTDDGVIFSRRMIRDKVKAESDRRNGSKGGNPTVKGGVNPLDNGGDKAQKPEARSQKPERHLGTSGSSNDPTTPNGRKAFFEEKQKAKSKSGKRAPDFHDLKNIEYEEKYGTAESIAALKAKFTRLPA